ncbi:DMT family transporter [Ligilactobacillus agilis]|uniref:Multidrug efflux SMR transporter n=1 Tax=Ligilactobacillus agilis TaxID=1601 RepID=A0A231Q724_9LACO|nr:multidrug efflux SMR transporter [Ligilactobacillus agilis]ASR40092.1 quaternary ammonium transporter [Ligilactobacillus agilis]MBM6772890.1 multidrug efflux SMR transporter [Ligilactobacillus agilis]MCL8206066.1 multidrug efflux SMR transporter [Ligilactobacillus agilis]MDM8280843.1 multidrug efflux SMR transporter [Ligilactobacillus agilis]NJE32464.1 multidrug efflux SMR transporter [Ligilactobacillus agilis]
MAYCYLLLAICLELIATNFLKLSAGFSRLGPTIITVSAYCACFYFFSLSLRGIKLSIAYATWSGVGIIFASLLSYFLFKESLTGWQLLGLGLIVCGTIIANLTGGH